MVAGWFLVGCSFLLLGVYWGVLGGCYVVNRVFWVVARVF